MIHWNITVRHTYTGGNPIRRRGVVASVGTAATYNQHYDDGSIESIHPGYIIDTKNLSQSSIVSNGNYASSNPVRNVSTRRIRDRISLHSRSSSDRKRTASQVGGSSYQYSQYATSDLSHLRCTHDQSGQLFCQQRDLPFKNSIRSNVVNDYDMEQTTPFQFASSDILGEKPVAQNSVDEKSLSNYCLQGESGYQESFDIMRQSNLGHDKCLHGNSQFQQFQKGIQRFKKQRPDLMLEEEGSNTNLFCEGNEELWGDTKSARSARIDHTLESKIEHSVSSGNDYIIRIESQGQWQPRQQRLNVSKSEESSVRTDWNQDEKEAAFGESYGNTMSYQHQPIKMFSENASNHLLYDITNGLNSTEGVNSPPNFPGISKFKPIGQQNISTSLTSFGKSYGKTISNQPQPIKMFSENPSNHPLCDITSGLNPNRGFESPSNSPGISKFKQRGQQNTNVSLDQSVRVRHSLSEKVILAHSTVSDGIDSFSRYPDYPDENRDELESSTSSLKFFNNQNEIDVFGNPLNTSVHLSPKTGRKRDLFRILHTESRDEKLGGGIPSITGQFGSQHSDAIQW